MEDAAWCAVAAPWLDSVQEYWSGKAGRPAAIDNSTIVDSEGNLKQGLVQPQPTHHKAVCGCIYPRAHSACVFLPPLPLPLPPNNTETWH